MNREQDCLRQPAVGSDIAPKTSPASWCFFPVELCGEFGTGKLQEMSPHNAAVRLVPLLNLMYRVKSLRQARIRTTRMLLVNKNSGRAMPPPQLYSD